jgi:hypothetical protein
MPRPDPRPLRADAESLLAAWGFGELQPESAIPNRTNKAAWPKKANLVCECVGIISSGGGEDTLMYQSGLYAADQYSI